jgi:hypothetical protein
MDGSAHMRCLTEIPSIAEVRNQSQHVPTHMEMQEPATCNMTVSYQFFVCMLFDLDQYITIMFLS